MDSVGLLNAGRAAFQGLSQYGRIGLSASSRQLAEDFMNGGIQLFNQLYASTEDQEFFNITQVMALRSQNRSLVSDAITASESADNGAVAASTTTGTAVDTEA